jgi:hypothetical protein
MMIFGQWKTEKPSRHRDRNTSPMSSQLIAMTQQLRIKGKMVSLSGVDDAPVEGVEPCLV